MSEELPEELVAAAREFIAGTTWTFAKTMAENPHWYCIVFKVTDDRIDSLLTLLWRYCHVRRWHGKVYRTVSLDGWDYWPVLPALNRKPSAVAGWDGDPRPPVGWLPAEYRRDMRGDEHVPIAQVDLWAYESDHWGVDPDSGVDP